VSQSIQTRTDRQVDVRTPAGETSGSVTLPGDLFDTDANVSLMHQVVVAQLAAARQGTHDTKTRGEVSGGGRKPYRQKGTGRARQGSTRSPQFAGGGVSHGPTPRDYNELVGVGTKVLVVVSRDDVLHQLSLRNLPNVHLIAPDQLNTYDVLVNDAVVFLQDAYELFLAGPIATAGAAKGVARESEVKPSLVKGAAAEADEAPYGPESHAPLADGSQPEGFPVKGNADSRLYHVPGSSFYARTDAEVWFASAEAAEAAGFQQPSSQRKEADK
jgi:large subunit ribosomal protein L4